MMDHARESANDQDKRHGEPHRRYAAGRFVRAAMFGIAVAAAAPAAALAANAPAAEPVGYADPAPVSGTQFSLYGIHAPALSPGLPSPEAAARVTSQVSNHIAGMSSRSIAAGVILMLFAGLAGLTYSMWRDLGRRVGAR